MAMTVPGALKTLESLHGLPPGFINDVGPETAADISVLIATGQAHVTPTGKIAWGPSTPSGA